MTQTSNASMNRISRSAARYLWRGTMTSMIALAATAAHAAPDDCVNTTGTTWVCEGDQSDGVRPGVVAGDPALSATDITIENVTGDVSRVILNPSLGSNIAPSQARLTVDTGEFGVTDGGIFVNRNLRVVGNETVIELSGSGITPDQSTWQTPAIFAFRGGAEGSSTSSNGNDGGRGANPGTISLILSNNTETADSPYVITWDPTTTDPDAAISLSSVAGTGGSGGRAFGTAGAGGNGGVISFQTTDEDLVIDTSAIGISLNASGGVARGGRSGSGTVSGGNGGAGGAGGDIYVQRDASGSASVDGSVTVTSTTQGAHGIFVSANGSDGANGGAAQTSGSAFGGNAGTGGDGGVIRFNVSPDSPTQYTITTFGDNADGVLAEAHAGDGGNGGRGSQLGQGGDGGQGGIAGSIIVSGLFDIETSGISSQGIGATGVGGEGGFAGGGGTRRNNNAGDAGQGAFVQVTTASGGSIATSGDLATGISAQSVGGYGADGTSSVGLVTFATSGGSGGRGRAVNIINEGDVTTRGFFATGLLATSIGGGGGHGGGTFGTFYGSGGGGSQGGLGSTVSVTNTGSIITGGASSPGIHAQSIGGTGGAGGTAGGIVALGGGSASGGNASSVTVTHLGSIDAGNPDFANSVTVSTDLGPCAQTCSPGILAQSIGGGGGAGGSSGGWFTVGGGAGGGGNGGDVTVSVGAEDTAASVTTYLGDSSAVTAHSIGGGGGNGGSAISGGLLAAAAVGGSGGTGGDGGDTTVSLQSATISTAGDRSHGLNAQSIGGGGGNGGFSVSGSVSLGVGVSVGVGGTGGSGGSSGTVSVSAEDASAISTSGDDSNAIMAQSIGGGGGSGGAAIAVNATISGPDGGVAVATGVGGSAGRGGEGETVIVQSEALIATEGDRSTGILAQSVGGGGGNGGLAVAGAITAGEKGVAISAAVGGGAGAGGVGGDVGVEQNWSVTTQGENADGIVAQSIGGGGGNGGTAVAASATISGKSPSVDVAVGGRGGAGGQSGEVNVDFNSSSASAGISTTGDLSDGIVAQSIAGGGGNGGLSGAGSFSLGESSSSVNVSIGGTGGVGGTADLVTVNTAGDQAISATGNGSKGIVAQSIGGGGGNGGLAGTGTFSNKGGSTDFNFGLGGTGGSSGESSDVIVVADSAIVTGTEADYTAIDLAAQQGGNAIVAQSISGSGGTGGLSASAIKSRGSSSSGNSGNRSLIVDIGGGGGGGGTVGNVDVLIGNSVTSLGHQSDAVIAQSIGASGGAGGGTIVYESANSTSKALNLSIGGKGGGSSPGENANVVIQQGGSVAATGAGSRGVLVQSIGGGGGSGGANHFSVKDGSSKGDVLDIGIGGGSGNSADGGAASFSMFEGGSVSTGRDMYSAPDEGSNFVGHAVTAQSVGGGGGAGGAGITGKVQTKGSDGAFAFNLGIGGTGRGGGNGGTVGVRNVDASTGNQSAIQGTITTTNWNSHGLFAQSVGGGGGSGATGINGNVTNASAKGLNVGLGAVGSGGGFGGAVTVLTDADVTVEADGSKGILAQSVGGGGGSGGFGVDGDISAGGGSGTKQLTFALGAKGTGGGAGGAVTIENGGAISTALNASEATGRDMDAIFAQSVGGGGGNGGFGIEGDLKSTDGSGGLELTLGIAGSAGSGGAGGAVSVDNTGALSFAGAGSRGILAQSIGGGGGNGGGGVVGNVTSASDASNSTAKRNHIDIGIGGGSGTSGAGGAVAVTNTAAITTDMSSSAAGGSVDGAGILAQSVGGGGGNAGIGIDGNVTGTKNTRVADIGIGGTGAGGGNSGLVEVTNSGGIAVLGDGVRGIHAQSIAGGGGNGAIGFSGTVATGSSSDNSKNSSGQAITFGLGRSGGSGGTAGEVIVNNSGAITTGSLASVADNTKNDAFAIHAQSIGGGGGTGTLTDGLVYGNVNDQDTAKGINFTLGSSLASGGTAESVSVTNAGALTTYNDGSHAIYAQSIGGGGGHLGSLTGVSTEDSSLTWGAEIVLGGAGSSGNGAESTVALSDASSQIATFGNASHGVFAQSIGGGGGAGGSASASTSLNAKIGIALGGQSGSSGDGGNVNVNGGSATDMALGSIATNGDSSIGILAQSIGGGGGTAGLNAAGLVTSTVSLGSTDNASVEGDAGDVSINYGGSIATSGNAAHAIIAQSVGGGGGLAGTVFLGGDSHQRWGTTTGMSGDGTSTGTGGVVDVALSGSTITTQSDSAMGVFAQSVGGGGGLQGEVTSTVTGAAIGSTGGTGAGQSVTVSLDNGTSVATTGDYAHAVFAQSSSGSTSDSVGDVTVTLANGSSIASSGDLAAGLFAQAIRTDGGEAGTVTVNIDETSSITGGAGVCFGCSTNSAIWVNSGTDDNTITNAGTIASATGASGIAVRYTGDASLTVVNSGTITGVFSGNTTFGSPLLGDEVNSSGGISVLNNAGGVLNLGGSSDITTLTNAGSIAVGAEGQSGTIGITGDFIQTGEGVLSFASTADGSIRNSLEIGGSAVLDGAIELGSLPNVSSSPVLGGQQLTLLTAAEGITLADSLDTPGSVVGQLSLGLVDPTVLTLAYEIDFANDTILDLGDTNADRLSAHLQDYYATGEMGAVLRSFLIGIESEEVYSDVLQTLSPELAIDTVLSTANAAVNFSDALMNCDLQAQAKTDENGNCVYGSFSARQAERSASSDSLGFDENRFGFTLGGRRRLGNGWSLGAAFRHESVDLDGARLRSGANGDQLFFGTSLAYDAGNWEIGGAVFGSYWDFDIARPAILELLANGSQDQWAYGGRVQAAYRYQTGDWQLAPRVAVGVTSVEASDFAEIGSGDFGFSVDGRSDTFVYVRPGIEVTGQLDTFLGESINPFLTVDITQYLGGVSAEAGARFLGASSAVDDFEIATDLDQTRVDIGTGFDFSINKNSVIRVGAFGGLSENTTEYGGNVNFKLRF